MPSESVGQAMPPWAAAMMMERVWLLVPPPQLWLQSAQEDHIDT
jgi:hypothetical protein